MIGIAPVVPVTAQSLVTAILHGPEGLTATLVDIEHLASILRRLAVEHLAAADGTSAMRVKLIAQGLHVGHVRFGDRFVARLIEYDAWIVAIVDYGVSHQSDALFPLPSFDILLGISGRHRLNQSNAVARLDILTPRRHMHPPDHVAARAHHLAV